MKAVKKIGYLFMCFYPYLCIANILFLSEIEEALGIDTSGFQGASSIFFLIIIILTVLLAIFAGKGKNPLSPLEIAKWVMIIKLAHIPYYVIVFIFGVIVGLLGLIPVPFMIFVSMGAIMLIFVSDYIFMLHSSALGIGAIVANRKVGKITKAEAIIYSIMQFFFCLDLVASIMLYARAKVADLVTKDGSTTENDDETIYTEE